MTRSDNLAIWQNDKVARSGNRPRFKWVSIQIGAKNKSNSSSNNTADHKRTPLIKLIALALVISVLQANISILNCDESNNNKLIQQRISTKSLHWPAPPPHSNQSNGGETNHQNREKSNHVDNYAAGRRFKRAGDQAAAAATTMPPDNEESDSDSLRVASFASKLEHWLQCNRLGSPQQPTTATQIDANQSPATATQANGCPAHFDGHLCWPPSKVGQRVQLACPKLNWWPRNGKRKQQQQQQHQDDPPLAGSGGKQSVKHVIDSIQQQQPMNNPPMELATNGQLSSIKLQAPATGTTTRTMDEQQQQQTGQSFAWRSCQQASFDSAGRRSIDSSPSTNSDPSITPSNNETLANSQPGRWQDEPDYSQCPQTKTGQFDPTDQWINLGENFDRQLFVELARALERIEANIDLYSDLDIQDQWSFCIGETMRQLRSDQAPASLENNNNETVGQFCPVIFDGWRCWPKTRAGEVAYVSCPSNQPGFSAERKAHKICTNQADWYRHPLTNRYWSNYTTCVDTVDLAFRTKILNLYIIGNLISLIALTASLIIFISFKSLNCTRVTIHKNLFLSFITNNLMWIIWYTYVVNDADLLQSNPIECQFWHILLHYFLVSNYFWMFCEGLYLHTLLVVAFVSEDKILKWFYLLGWLTPVPITIAYAYNRSYDEYYTNFCWMEESPHNIILMAPIGISLLLNLIFLINIVRVLVTKLRANNSPDTHQTRKAVRATLILIPLLGLHYMLTPFRPEAKSEWEVIYEIVAAVCTSFQGLCVALLFCFCNGEVISVIKKKLKDTFRAREPVRSRSGTKSGSHCTGLAFGSSKFSSGSTNNNNNHHHHHQHQLEASHTLRSIVSTSSQSDLVQVISTKVNSAAVGLAGQTAGDLPGNNNNNTNGDGHARPHSNSNSVLTTVTASPISINNHTYHQLQSSGAANHIATALTTPYCETILQDTVVVQSNEEEAVKLL